MSVLTQYSNISDGEFLRKLEYEVVPDETEVRIDPELWQEVLLRMEKLVKRGYRRN